VANRFESSDIFRTFAASFITKEKEILTMKPLRTISAITLLMGACLMQGFKADDAAMKKEKGTYIVNTTTLGRDVEGYNGPTPVKIYIRKGKVEKVEILKNQDGPKYMAKVKKALEEAWNGEKVKAAKDKQVDAVTGATYSSEAVIKNVRLGLDYYLQHK